MVSLVYSPLPEGFSGSYTNLLGELYLIRMRDGVRFFLAGHWYEKCQCERCLCMVSTEHLHLHRCVAWTAPLSRVVSGPKEVSDDSISSDDDQGERSEAIDADTD